MRKFQTINKESLRLYRDVLRACKYYTWEDEKGVPWSKVLKVNARREFEAARHERDPTIIAQMLVAGRDYLNKSQERYMDTYAKLMGDASAGKGIPSSKK